MGILFTKLLTYSIENCTRADCCSGNETRGLSPSFGERQGIIRVNL
jgi:hypothetical protein